MRRTLEEAGVRPGRAEVTATACSLGRIDQAIADAPDEAWERHSCGDGAKAHASTNGARLPSISVSDGGKPTHERCVLGRRSPARPNEIAYYLAYTPNGTSVADPVRIAAPAGRSRKPSRPPRTNAASTSTRSVAIRAGTGTSRLPRSPTRS
ncbi:hypothetical protein ACFQ3Z_08905 [Streptomyces nogalater]